MLRLIWYLEAQMHVTLETPRNVVYGFDKGMVCLGILSIYWL